MTPRSHRLLRQILLADAATCVAAGLLMALGAAWLAPVTGLPLIVLREAGLILLPFAAWLAWLGLRRDVPYAGTRLAVAANVLWVIGSVALAAFAPWPLTPLGYTFIAAQAIGVALLAAAEAAALPAGASSPEHAS